MISILLYGRNDVHGYNLHRRAALSLNCLAEVLTHDEDEIVFVDYNTPDELPTFVEALADTLTTRCLSRLRVLRVPAAIHRARFQPLTHLPAVEPVCRNAAARRSNPANRWLLSTNTDMILVPHPGGSLSDICAGLTDGFYGLPRFELPEWLWEQLPRSEPETAIEEVRRLGPLLHLDEASPSHEWVRFDAPGDFQLCLRDDFVAVDGFDERMLLGWHVDSNLSRRLLLHRGSIESLEHGLSGYHCNHNRTPTVYHGQPVGNDPKRFFLTVDHADVPDQRETWGLADIPLQEIPVGRGVGVRVTEALLAAMPAAATHDRPAWNPFEAALALTYDSAHVLPHIVDSIVVSGRPLAIGYLGANPVLRDMIDRVVRDLSQDESLRFRHASDAGELDGLVEFADLFVVDFGLDATLGPKTTADPGSAGVGVPSLPTSLRRVVAAFEQVVRSERTRIGRGAHPRRFLLINSTTVYLDTFVMANLDCSSRATHSRVRRATVKAVPTSTVHLLRDIRWADRLESPPTPLVLRLGTTTSLGDEEDFGWAGPGWWLPDAGGIWTHGSRAVVTVRCAAPAWTRPSLDLRFDRVGVRRGRPVRIGLVIDGARVDTRVMKGGSRLERWQAKVPSHALAKRAFDVALELDGSVEWADDNLLGLHLREVRLRTGLLPRPARESLERATEALARLAERARGAAGRRVPLLRALRPRRRPTPDH